ncbi:MAG: helix-turn-helix transcriptional regulator, partial [Oscillospiraceae bacterium]|nr:helix-turn-helix transcriptional regulator [Oscillospiraceae bacterium]
AEKISLADVAHHFYISESTITQTFRKKMGVSFYRCVTQRRLIAAKALILDGLAMDCVGEQVGFTDYSSFFRAFKQEYGMSPTQYKKLQTAVQESHS